MLHLPDLIIDLALILGAAALVTLIFKRLKQPIVLGYIIAGFLVGPNFHLFPTIVEFEGIRTWADIGVIFLLFSLGLEFSFKKLIKVGGSALVTALTGVTLTMLLGYGLGQILGWNSMDCLFLGGLLSIASTSIIIRTFDEFGIRSQKFTGLVTGVLVIEDLVAVVLMVVLSTVAIGRTFEGVAMLQSVLKLAFFLVLWFTSGIFFLPSLLKKIRTWMNDETLLIVSLALCFLMVILATYAGFSPALGAFIMGSILAETTKAEKIEQVIKPIRNLFGAIFFVSVGMLIDPQMVVTYALPILGATLVLLIGKPLFVTLGSLISGQTLKVSVQSGMSLSQIGEFSFIIATLGLTLKVTSEFLYPIAVAVSVCTAFTTPYMVRFSEKFYHMIEKALPTKLLLSMSSYSSNVQTVRNVGEWRTVLRSYALVLTLNSIIVIGLTILSSRFLAPFMISKFSSIPFANVLTGLITLLVSAPFLLGLTLKQFTRSAVHVLWQNRKTNRVPLIALEISRMVIAVFLIGFMFNQLFSSVVALIVAIFVTVLIITVFRKHLQVFYSLLERRFISNLNARDEQVTKKTIIDTLQWDAHVAEFDISQESAFVGKDLLSLKFREEFGVNIARIDRGKITIHIPTKQDQLFPGDRISVIGTDEQLARFKSVLESSEIEIQENVPNNEVVVQRFVVQEDSKLIGKTIRESGIREHTQGMIVGIEREGTRLLNPESNMIFAKGDILWVAGEEIMISSFGDADLAPK